MRQHTASAFSDEPLGPERPQQRVDLGIHLFLRDVVLPQELSLYLRAAVAVGEELPKAGAGRTKGEDPVGLQVYEHDLVAEPAERDVGAGRGERRGWVTIVIRSSVVHVTYLPQKSDVRNLARGSLTLSVDTQMGMSGNEGLVDVLCPARQADA